MPRLLSLLVVLLPALSAPIAHADENWPQFRGPRGDGSSTAAGLPVAWSETENIVWKTPIRDRGWSSPVVWGDQIWMTTATADGRAMFAVCVDRNSGKILHDVKIFDTPEPEEIHALNSYASPTPVVESGRVYVHFGTYGTACLDTHTADILWTRRDLRCDHFRGPGSSPYLLGNLLILHFDGIDVQYLVALDKRTGKTVWHTDRSTDFGDLDGDFRKAYSTPIAISVAGRQQLISPGANATMAYDPTTGKEIWNVRYKGFSNTCRPLFDQELVYLTTGFGKNEIWAVRPDGRGDVTDSHVVWRSRQGVPKKPSPVLVDGLIYMIEDSGILTCLEAKTGETIWRERIGGEFSASPVVADGRIYVCDQQGTTTAFKPGREYRRLAANRLDAGCMASPAVVGKAIYLRTETHLYRIERQ